MTAVLASSPGKSPPESSRERISYSLQPWLVGTYAACLASVCIWIPWYWFDEVVTISAAKKSWPDLYATLTQVDAVHAFYYAFMKLWTTAFGFSEFSTRFPSAICIGLTSVLLVHLGRQMFTNRVGIMAGLVYPLIPVAVWMGGEARSYAASALACTGLVVAFQRAASVQTFDWRRWSIVVIAFVVAVWVFMFNALAMIPLALLLRRRLRLGYLARLLVCACAAGLAVMPILYEASTQRSQVSWIGSATLVELARSSLGNQYFRGQYVFALLALITIVAGIWVTLRLDSSGRRTNLLFLVLWCVIPTVLLGMTDLLMPQGLYLPRYLAFTTPAVAVLMSLAIARLGRAKSILAVSVIAVAALPALMLRTDVMAKSSWQYAAQVITDRAAAGDAWIAFSHTSVLGETYPRFFDDMTLLNDTGPDDSYGLLKHFGGPLRGSLTVPPRITRVWYLSDRMSVVGYEGPGLALLENQGFRVVWTSRERVGPDGLTIYLLERDPT